MTIDEWSGDGIPDEVSEQASRWIAMLDSEEIDPLEWNNFSKWLEQDPMNRWAFEELSEVWARLETLGDSRHLLDEPHVIVLPIANNNHAQETSIANQRHSIIAISLILVGLFFPFVEHLF
ncbi:MAG: DUF4880 domain-containing protein [Kangiellaceae bacterium]|nr:DUF4880 domain-containing protein [Kangiellaceae bacterium]